MSLCSIKLSHQLERRRDEPALVHQRGKLVDEERREKAYEGIDEIMRLDIDRSATQQDVKRQQDVRQPLAYAPRHNHHNGGYAHVRAGESRRRALAHLLRSLNQIEEETLVETRAGYQIVVRIEIIADGGEIARVHLIHADSGEIELRARHGQHDVDKVIDEERGDQSPPR